MMNKAFLITVSLVLSCFWMFWYPGVKVATDYHLSSDTGLLSILPWSWRESNVADGMGEYTTFTLWSQPLLSLSELMNLISLNSEIQTKLKGAAIIFFGFLGMWKLLDYLKINDWGKSIGSTFFILNSFFLLMFDGGQFSLNLAYIALPFATLSFMKLFPGERTRSLEVTQWKERVKFSLVVLLISIFDIRVVFLLLITLGVYLIFRISFRLLPNLLILCVFTALILIGFHAYWIFPSLLSKTPHLPLTYDRLSQVNFLSFSSMGHSIFLQQPHWFENIFGQVGQLRSEFILIPILVFLAPILIKKNVFIGFWLIIAAAGIFLSKGSQDPFPGVYLWLFSHFPLFSLFRDPVKFYFLTSLSYSVLIAISIGQLSTLRFKSNLVNKFIQISPFLIIIYFIWLIRPVFLGEMTGMFSRPIFESEFNQLSSIIKADQDFSRVFWIPTQAPLGYSTNTHPTVEAARLSQKRPFAASVKGTYETFNFLREATYMGQIFDISGIGYIAYPYLDERRDNMHPDNIQYYYTFLDQLSNLPWLSKVSDSSIPLFKTKKHQNRFFITANVWWVIGSDDIYSEVTKSAELKLSKNALIFAEEYAGLGATIDELPQAKIVLNNKTNLDLAASFMDPSNLIFPAKNLDFDPDVTSGWWKRETADLIRWRDFLQTKYDIDNQDFDLGGGWAVGEGNKKYQIVSKETAFGRTNIKYPKDSVLLARVLESTRSGKLNFYQDDNLIGEISTKKEGNNVRWFEVGELTKESGQLTVESSGDINVVNALAVLDQKEWNKFQSKAQSLENRIVDFNEKNAKPLQDKVSVTYTQINPTKYKVIVKNLTEPAFLVFSQSHDKLWKMKGQESLPIYSLLNGFWVDKDGEYEVYFEPQKYVYPGLAISIITVAVIITLLLKDKPRTLKI